METLNLPKIPNHIQYTIGEEGDIVVVRAISEADASRLIREVKIDLKEYPIMRCRWKVSNVIMKSDVRAKKGDDYAA